MKKKLKININIINNIFFNGFSMRKSIIERDIMKVLERGNEVLNNLQKECNVEKRKIF